MATAAAVLKKPAERGDTAQPWLWAKGQSGNPAGRPKGARNQATVWAERFAAAALRALLRAVAAGEVAPAEATPVADLIERGKQAAEEEATAAATAVASKPATTASKPSSAAAAAPTRELQVPSAAPPSVFSSVIPSRRASRKELLLAGVSALALTAALGDGATAPRPGRMAA